MLMNSDLVYPSRQGMDSRFEQMTNSRARFALTAFVAYIFGDAYDILALWWCVCTN